MGKIHSVAICKKETFEQWKRRELLCFDGVLLSPIDCVSSTTKVAAKKLYIKIKMNFKRIGQTYQTKRKKSVMCNM